MLAYRVREHKKTDQTEKKIENKHSERSGRFFKIAVDCTRINVLSVFFIAALKSRSVHIGPRPTIYLSGLNKIIPHEFHVFLSPQTKRGCTSKIKVDVIIKVLVFRTLCCVVARIALATEFCCCWSIRSAPRRDKQEARKKVYLERYYPVILRILICGERG